MFGCIYVVICFARLKILKAMDRIGEGSFLGPLAAIDGQSIKLIIIDVAPTKADDIVVHYL